MFSYKRIFIHRVISIICQRHSNISKPHLPLCVQYLSAFTPFQRVGSAQLFNRFNVNESQTKNHMPKAFHQRFLSYYSNNGLSR